MELVKLRLAVASERLMNANDFYRFFGLKTFNWPPFTVQVLYINVPWTMTSGNAGRNATTELNMRQTPETLGELVAQAIKDHYLQHIADYHTNGRVHWAIPMVVLLNYHLISRGLVPICFSTIANEDDCARVTERAAHSTTIVVDKVPIKVENRKDVIAELIQFIKDDTSKDHTINPNPKPNPNPVLAYLTVSTNSIYCILVKAMLLQLPTRHKLIKSLFALCWNDIKTEA